MSDKKTGSKLQNLAKVENAIKEKQGPHEKKAADKDSNQAKSDMQSEGGKT